MRIDLESLCVIEKKDQIRIRQDLRLKQPFEELTAYVNSFDLPSLPIEEHTHTPYVILLL